jgi:hypothetical protein
MRVNPEHLRENAYEISFLFEIADDVIAKRPVMRGKRFAFALQKVQNRTGLTLGQHPDRGKRFKLHAGVGNELIEGFGAFRFVRGLVASYFHRHAFRVNAQKAFAERKFRAAK